MSKPTKPNLGLPVVFSIAGILFNPDVIDASGITVGKMTLRLVAVFLGMFVICYMLGKESARFDAEHTGRY